MTNISNPLKREFDKASILNDITERENIISKFATTGILDRLDAIRKIETLQTTDAELVLAAAAKRAECGSVNLYQANDNTIISNIQFQLNYLKVKLAKLELEENQNGGYKAF